MNIRALRLAFCSILATGVLASPHDQDQNEKKENIQLHFLKLRSIFNYNRLPFEQPPRCVIQALSQSFYLYAMRKQIFILLLSTMCLCASGQETLYSPDSSVIITIQHSQNLQIAARYNGTQVLKQSEISYFRSSA